jgi:aspartate ammonia-lyase
VDGQRTERDFLGEAVLPAGALYGIHTWRALENFYIHKLPVPLALATAYGSVKLACAKTNHLLGAWKDEPEKAQAIFQACGELANGTLAPHIVVNALQGGAGTSTNMNVNEVLANRVLQILGDKPGNYGRVSPHGDLNLHQSTNDTYPTALRLAAIRLLKDYEQQLVLLQEAFQHKEREFESVIKVGRTQLQDAVPTTLGREMGAYAETVSRDRWRIYKCEERLRVINLGGTAIGSGLAAPRQYVFRAVEQLREITGIGFARAENLTEATQNADAFAEVSGIVKASATSLLKICTDLRLLSSGPDAGLGEINLPRRQAGSSIMPGKVNPVIPEAASQAAMMALGYDHTLTTACALGNLELNPFLPLVAHCLLSSIEQLTRATRMLRELCIDGITANEQRCREHVLNSTALATVLVPHLGYEEAGRISQLAQERGCTVREAALAEGAVTDEQLEGLLKPEAVLRLGLPGPLDAGSGSGGK